MILITPNNQEKKPHVFFTYKIGGNNKVVMLVMLLLPL